MAFRFGECGHPLRAAERGGGCRVCSLLRLTSDECYDYFDDHSASYHERCDERGTWHGREDEANAWELPPSDFSGEAHFIVRRRFGHGMAADEHMGWTFAPLVASGALPGKRYDPVSGEPFAEYMRGVDLTGDHVDDAVPIAGRINTIVNRRRTFAPITGIES